MSFYELLLVVLYAFRLNGEMISKWHITNYTIPICCGIIGEYNDTLYYLFSDGYWKMSALLPIDEAIAQHQFVPTFTNIDYTHNTKIMVDDLIYFYQYPNNFGYFDFKTESYTFLQSTAWLDIPYKNISQPCITYSQDHIILISGYTGTIIPLPWVLLFNLLTEKWIFGPNLVRSRFAAACTPFNFKEGSIFLYVIGGVYSQNFIEKLDITNLDKISSNTWNITNSKPTLFNGLERGWIQTIVHLQKIYLLGGLSLECVDQCSKLNFYSANYVDILDPYNNDIITNSLGMNEAKYSSIYMIIRNRILSLGGLVGSQIPETIENAQFTRLTSYEVSNKLTLSPTISPSNAPTNYPTAIPTLSTETPSNTPTHKPSTSPTNMPTNNPTVAPILSTNDPSNTPTFSPFFTNAPTDIPTYIPTRFPSNTPSLIPSISPMKAPSVTPTIFPTITPNVASIISNNTESKLPKSIKIVIICVIILITCLFITFILLLYKKKTKQQMNSEQYISQNNSEGNHTKVLSGSFNVTPGNGTDTQNIEMMTPQSDDERLQSKVLNYQSDMMQQVSYFIDDDKPQTRQAPSQLNQTAGLSTDDQIMITEMIQDNDIKNQIKSINNNNNNNNGSFNAELKNHLSASKFLENDVYSQINDDINTKTQGNINKT